RARAERPGDHRGRDHHRGDRRRPAGPDRPPRQPDPQGNGAVMAEDTRQQSAELETIPGSRRFDGTLDDSDIAAGLPPTLELHTAEGSDQELDPATYEIVRHRMWSMTDDMASVLKHMSGSPVVSEANDFNFVVADEVGETTQIAHYNIGL